MKKIPILDSLKSRKFRYGGYATLMVVMALAVVVIISLIMDQVSWKVDLTRRRVFTLSEQTHRVLDGLEENVTITTIAYGGQENPSMKEILRRYASRSKKIALQTIDPDRNPGWSRQYVKSGGFLRDGAIVVATAGRFKTIDPYDLVMATTDLDDPTGQPQVVSFSAEKELTSALLYATAERDMVVYAIQGHGESNFDVLSLTTAAAYENYEVRYISLLTVDAVPSDADILLVLGPTLDLTAEDAVKIRSYLTAGGRAAFLLDIPAVPNSRPVTNDLLKSYGVNMRNLVVVEGDTTRIVLNNPLYLLPRLEYHDITEPLNKNNLPVFIPTSQAIEVLTAKKQNLTVEPLLSSSVKSWGKEKYQNLQSLDKAEGDPGGPFTLAAAITEKSIDPAKKDAKLIVVASALFLQPEFTSAMPGNSELFLNALGWLREKELSISIRPKDMRTSRLTISSKTSYVLSGIAVILMPLIVLGWGLVVWIRRRHL
jgi:ABC-type uncharacterized transport system involved in gliding motility auxiliary subunit